jgi:hypothetical protein
LKAFLVERVVLGQLEAASLDEPQFGPVEELEEIVAVGIVGGP